MKIATVLFTYNRSIHTGKVLEALSKNEVLPQKLYIFQDGVKESTNLEEWEKVSQVIKAVDWCDVELVIHKKNKGLADSIVYGLDYVFEKNDAVIVLEDDCVPHSQFMTFMNNALTKYVDEKKVYSISGHAWPIEVRANGKDAYFSGRISSTGWATWRDRWLEYERDYRLLGKIKKDDKLKEQLHIWGDDLEGHVLGNVYGRCDSWAVFWALKVIEKNGLCLTPYHSYIKNLGFDGSGVHSGLVPIPEAEFAVQKDIIDLPDVIKIYEECKERFKEHFRWKAKEEKLEYYNRVLTQWLGSKQKMYDIKEYFRGKGIRKIAIWGTGNLCDLLIEELKENVEIAQIVVSRKSREEYRTIPVVELKELDKNISFIIVIPGYDINEIKNKIQETYNCDVMTIEEIVKKEIEKDVH